MRGRAAGLAPLLLLGACVDPAPQSASDLALSGASYCDALSARLEAVGPVASDLADASVVIGGLSGIEFDPARGRYLLVTDDRGANGGARLYTASLVRQAGAITLRVENAVSLESSHAGDPAGARPAVDLEAIRLLNSASLIWASEGDEAKGVAPGVFLSAVGATRGSALPLPPLLVSGPAKGPRPNRSFEGLARGSKPGRYYLSLEAPLAETDTMPTLEAGGAAPIFELDTRGTIHAQFRYPLEPIARQLPGRLADNGISEILAPAPGAFLVLERSGSQQVDGSFRFVSRLFCAWRSATSAQREVVDLRKTLLMDFAAAGVGDLANIEGMTLGPHSADGRASLVLVSDNDFSPERPSQVILLSLHASEGR